MSARIEALLFDLGGVVIDIDFNRVTSRWAELAGVPLERLAPAFTDALAYQRYERSEIDTAGYFQALREELGIDLSDAHFEDGWNAIFVGEIEPTVSMLPAWTRELPAYVFSNTNATHHRYFAKRYAKALEPFRKVYVSNEVGIRKPDRAAFEHVARDMGVAPQNILFLDDMAVNVEGARAVGMQAALIRGPDDTRAAVEAALAARRQG